MTTFFLKGPLPILPNGGPMKGVISLPFVCTLMLNTMFIVRVLCIENAFLTSYRYQSYPTTDSFQYTERNINPIIPSEYRLLAYFTPVFISFTINLIKLVCTGTNLLKCIRKYPQIILASCFTPFMFEGCNENSIRMWKFGTVLNALVLGCLPQIMLLYMEFYRGTVNWDFVGSDLIKENIYENNGALFKHWYGNCLFASISGIWFLFLIIFTFSANKIVPTHKMCCKRHSKSCSICPQNFILFSQILCLSSTSEINSIPTKDEEDSIYYICKYSNGSETVIPEEKSLVMLTKLRQVDIMFS